MLNPISLKLTVVSAWNPPDGLFFLLLIIGALVFAAVGLFVFTFYEDYYWNDKEYREELRWNGSKNKRKA